MRPEKSYSLAGGVSEMLKALGRIIGDLAMLRFKTMFWLLRLCMVGQIGAAAASLALAFRPGKLAGAAFMLLGVVFIVLTRRAVTAAGPTGGTELLTGGTFAVVRHPMYSGCCLTVLSAAAITDHWAAYTAAAVYTVVMLSICCGEDEENRERFGQAYVRYSRQVWLTGIVLGLARLALRHVRGRRSGRENGKGA